MSNAAGQSIESPNDQGFPADPVCISHEAIERRSRVFRAGNSFVHVLFENCPASVAAVLPQFSKLHVRTLTGIIRRNPGINCSESFILHLSITSPSIKLAYRKNAFLCLERAT